MFTVVAAAFATAATYASSSAAIMDFAAKRNARAVYVDEVEAPPVTRGATVSSHRATHDAPRHS